MARRRSFSVFNLSFLDIMSCGFGSVVLFFMIISAQVSVRADQENIELLAETNLLEEEVFEGRKNLVRARTTLEEQQRRMSSLSEEQRRLEAELQQLREQRALEDDAGLSARESVADLQADIERLEASKKRLTAEIEAGDKSGAQVRRFTGEGDRQYLTGIRIGGKRVLFLVDASASMLGRTYVNALLYRNMPDSTKLRTPKWRSVVEAVDWVTTRLPPESDFQMYAFNKEAWSLVEGSAGEWVPVGDGAQLDAAVDRLKITPPVGGTNLSAAFAVISNIKPRPDNVYLLTDGLPTQSRRGSDRERMVSQDRRIEYFGEAIGNLNQRVPINVFLFPMDGDPSAASLFWKLAIDTEGSLMTPSSDWP